MMLIEHAEQCLIVTLCFPFSGELWMNLDGDLSPVCINILPLVASFLEQ